MKLRRSRLARGAVTEKLWIRYQNVFALNISLHIYRMCESLAADSSEEK